MTWQTELMNLVRYFFYAGVVLWLIGSIIGYRVADKAYKSEKFEEKLKAPVQKFVAAVGAKQSFRGFLRLWLRHVIQTATLIFAALYFPGALKIVAGALIALFFVFNWVVIGIAIGLIMYEYEDKKFAVKTLVMTMLPHAIFELPSLYLLYSLAALPLMIGISGFHVLGELALIGWLGLGVAAIIETFVTPKFRMRIEQELDHLDKLASTEQ